MQFMTPIYINMLLSQPIIDQTPLPTYWINEEAMINTIQYLPGIGSSDHVCLQFELLCYSASRKASLG